MSHAPRGRNPAALQVKCTEKPVKLIRSRRKRGLQTRFEREPEQLHQANILWLAAADYVL